MPRVVFQLLWDHIQSGEPVVAFVKNLAHDGRYYWVVALVLPIPDGYLSVRIKPTSPLLPVVEKLYAKLRTIETALEAESNDRKGSIVASSAALQTSLAELGFASYDGFMQSAFKQEMQSREAAIKGFVRPALKAGSAETSPNLESLIKSARMFDQLLDVLNILFSDLEIYVGINEAVRAKSGSVTDISESLRVSALNGVITVDKLGSRASGLRPVLDWLRVLSEEITKEGARLSLSLEELVKDVNLVVFGLSAAKLQIEMTSQFAHELVDDATINVATGSSDRMSEGAIGKLHASSCKVIREALGRLAAIKDRLQDLTESQLKLLQSSRSLRPIYLTGKIEMVDGDGRKLANIFKDIGSQMAETATNLDALKNILHDLDAHLVRGLAHGAEVEETIGKIDAGMMVPV